MSVCVSVTKIGISGIRGSASNEWKNKGFEHIWTPKTSIRTTQKWQMSGKTKVWSTFGHQKAMPKSVKSDKWMEKQRFWAHLDTKNQHQNHSKVTNEWKNKGFEHIWTPKMTNEWKNKGFEHIWTPGPCPSVRPSGGYHILQACQRCETRVACLDGVA